MTEPLDRVPVRLPKERSAVRRFEIKRTLAMISIVSAGWLVSDLLFTHEFQVRQYPRGFAQPGDEVTIQVAIRLVPDPKDCSLKGMKIHYRYRRTIVSRTEGGFSSREENEDQEEEITSEEVFETPDVIEVTEWVGTYLEGSQQAVEFRKMLRAIGKTQVDRVLRKTQENKNKGPRKQRHRKSPFS